MIMISIECTMKYFEKYKKRIRVKPKVSIYCEFVGPSYFIVKTREITMFRVCPFHFTRKIICFDGFDQVFPSLFSGKIGINNSAKLPCFNICHFDLFITRKKCLIHEKILQNRDVLILTCTFCVKNQKLR